MTASEREQFLQRLALFSDLEASELQALADVAQVARFPASALIFREGEAGDCAYIVVCGSVQAGFGIFAPRNAISVGALFVGALSVVAALFLIEELYSPLDGLIAISRTPTETAIRQLGQ